jgi:uncharacterized membrane protein
MKDSQVRTWHDRQVHSRTFGERMADTLASGMGSWAFIIVQTVLIVLWVALNLIAWMRHWDPYPFILLNLLFSTQAAYAAPIIMMSQNRQADRDRHHAEADYETNRRAKVEIENIQRELARIENEKLDRILAALDRN